MKISVLDQAPISVGMSAAQALQNSIDLAQLCDRLGYERYWVAEHHGMPSVACPAPEILLARLGAETRSIRIGSGGIMLPHYAPLKVVEQFAVLEALYPGRIDLGVGRAPGGTQLESLALMRHRENRDISDDFVKQLMEVRAFLDQSFPPDHLFKRIKISPATDGKPGLWLLGSSLWSAQAAAHLGLPLAFAHFFAGNVTREVFEHYQSNYQANAGAPKPQSMIAVGVICADTDDEAYYLSSSVRVLFSRLSRGHYGPVPSPDTAMEEIRSGTSPDASTRTEFPRIVHGNPDTVRAKLEEMVDALNLDEIIVVTTTYDHQARRRSYQLLADVFALPARYA